MILPNDAMYDRTDNLGLHERAMAVDDCYLRPSRDTLAANDLVIDVLPGCITVDDHPVCYAGVEGLACNAGNTLSALSEVCSAVVAYWNPAISQVVILVVDGDEALTSAGAAYPTSDEIEAALPDSGYRYVVLGAVKFKKDATSIHVANIDHQVRPAPVFTDSVVAANSTTTAHLAGSAGAFELERVVSIEVDAADLANDDVLTGYPLNFYGKVGGGRVVTTKAITTGAKTATMNVEINTTTVTGWGAAVAGAKALGSITDMGTATAAHTFIPGDTLSIEASAVTSFVEGRVRIEVDLYRAIGSY